MKMKSAEQRRADAGDLRDRILLAQKSSVDVQDLFDGIISVLTLQGATAFPFRGDQHRRVAAAFRKLIEDVDELFGPLGVENHCLNFFDETLVRVIHFSMSLGMVHMTVPSNGILYISYSVEQAEKSLSETGHLPGNRQLYEELLRRLRRYYDDVANIA